MSRAVLHHQSSAGVAQLIVSVALRVEMQDFEVTEIQIGEVFLKETCKRPDVFAAGSSPKIGRHLSRSSFPAEGMARFQERQRVQEMSFFDYHGQKRSANKSLERTPDEQGCFASRVVCGRRSALR